MWFQHTSPVPNPLTLTCIRRTVPIEAVAQSHGTISAILFVRVHRTFSREPRAKLWDVTFTQFLATNWPLRLELSTSKGKDISSQSDWQPTLLIERGAEGNNNFIGLIILWSNLLLLNKQDQSVVTKNFTIVPYKFWMATMAWLTVESYGQQQGTTTHKSKWNELAKLIMNRIFISVHWLLNSSRLVHFSCNLLKHCVKRHINKSLGSVYLMHYKRK